QKLAGPLASVAAVLAVVSPRLPAPLMKPEIVSPPLPSIVRLLAIVIGLLKLVAGVPPLPIDPAPGVNLIVAKFPALVLAVIGRSSVLTPKLIASIASAVVLALPMLI